MEDNHNYYCQYCEQFWDLDLSVSYTCPSCNEYKGLIKISDNPELVPE